MHVCGYVRAFSFKVIPLRMLQSLKMTIEQQQQQLQSIKIFIQPYIYMYICSYQILLERKEIIK